MNEKQRIACHSIIHSASVAAGAVGAIPIPAPDTLVITPIQVGMAIALGRVFGMELTKSTAEGIARAETATVLGQTASRLLIKGIPVIGPAANGTIAVGLTESLGWRVAKKFDKETSS